MTGDIQDIFARLKGNLPPWFGDHSPIVDAVLWGCATVLSACYSLISVAKLQMRLSTMLESWLDLFCGDFLDDIKRKNGESDNAFRIRIKLNLFRIKATRPAMEKVLFDVTGAKNSIIVEPQRPADCFCLGVSALGAGRCGNYDLPYQAFISVKRSGAANSFPGLNAPQFAFGGQAVLIDQTSLQGQLSDQDILDAINSTKPEGVIAWVNIQ